MFVALEMGHERADCCKYPSSRQGRHFLTREKISELYRMLICLIGETWLLSMRRILGASGNSAIAVKERGKAVYKTRA